MRDPKVIWERSFVLALWLVAVGAVLYLGYRLYLGQSLQGDTEPFPVMRTTDVVVGPDGHGYRYIAARDATWESARDDAAKLAWQGHPGYLATIDSKAEFDFIIGTVFQKQYPDVTYIGGRQTAPRQWRWVTGPDAAADGGRGKLFWAGDEKGAAQNGEFADWMFSAWHHGDKWDARKVCCATLFSYRRPQFSTSLGDGDRAEAVAGYLVEFGG